MLRSQPEIDRLIVNSPYEEPSQHWRYERVARGFGLIEGRRPAGWVETSGDSRGFDDPGVLREIPLINRIRERVKAWRQAGYPGITGITKRLLEHWQDPEGFESRRFFFCQLEAAETLIWLLEAPPAEHVGIEIPSDGSAYTRLCAKMATGSGKTVVMAMVIAWHILNKVANPRDPRFAKNVLVVAPGLTVRSRLAVLGPSHPENYYEAFRIVPPALLARLRRGRVEIRNWHALGWETDAQIKRKRGVDKRGVRSDEAWVRDVLGRMSGSSNVLVINDEAHHAWRDPVDARVKGVTKKARAEATKWISGLDRIHRVRGIRMCYDFSATPFLPGKKTSEESLFRWIVSDFGLTDAIESGLVKTPRVVIRDDAVPDAHTYKSRLYHIYDDVEVKDDLNRRAAKPEDPLPSLVMNGYYLLGCDWLKTAKEWRDRGNATPPVMITVANRTETAARVKYAFDHGKILIDELCDPACTLHIDSRVLDKAEATEDPIAEVDPGSPKPSRDQQAEFLRQQVDTVGQPGQPGERIQNVISVGMLSEGWDAKTVTHIMGLRAFTSPLLCEQVVGRGLRRTSYDVNPATGLYDPEYVNVFGIPFSFLPHEGRGDPPPPVPPKTAIEPLKDRSSLAITWPNIVRINHTYQPRLSLDWDRVEPLNLDASHTAQLVELAPTLDGTPDLAGLSFISLAGLAREHRTQRIIFETARDVYDQMREAWRGDRSYLLGQVVRLTEQFIRSDKVVVMPGPYGRDDLVRRLIITLNMTSVVNHIWKAIRHENTERLEPVFDREEVERSTGDMRTWHTTKPCQPTKRSHINYCVCDSTWEASDAHALDHAPEVEAWAKNDHLGFEISYIHQGVVRKYRPDFLVRLTSGSMLVLETKGRDTSRTQTQREFLAEWVQAVNTDGRFGRWAWDVSLRPGEIHAILARHLDLST